MSFITPAEEFFDAPLKGPGHKSSWFMYFASGVTFVVFKICFRYHIEGAENMEGLGDGMGAVVAINHSCAADPVFIGLALHRNCRFIGKEELFENRLAAQVLARIGGFPVKRGRVDRQCIRRAVNALKRGENIGIFPEGTRVKDHAKPAESHAGVSVIAQMAGARIVPIGLEGTDRIKPPGSHLLHFPRVHVRIGKPILLATYDAIPKRDRMQFIADDVMRQVYELRDGTYDAGESPYKVPLESGDATGGQASATEAMDMQAAGAEEPSEEGIGNAD